jgi:ATP-dependent Clp protease ATP-binding subunit ClpC
MYERFTDHARKVLVLAQAEAQRLNHEYIGTEHILLGLVRLETGVAAQVLKNVDIDVHEIRLEVEKNRSPVPTGYRWASCLRRLALRR